VARSTVAKSPNSHQPFAPTTRPKPLHEFLVFSNGNTECPWHIVAVGSGRTVSRHKSLSFALRKCNRLNEQRGEIQVDPLKVALSGFPDVNTYRAYYEGVGNDF
jgi:hypothetical protein